MNTAAASQSSVVAGSRATVLIQPVAYWAGAGVAILTFWAYVLGKWVTGPYFVATPPGPTLQPVWMQTAGNIFQAAMILVLFIVAHQLIVKPWRAGRGLTVDGAFMIAFFTLFFQDQISNAGGGYWFIYNANLFNRGSWFPEMPGWLTYAAPGHTSGEPLLMMGPGYTYFFLIMTAVGMLVLKKATQAWPLMPMPVLLLGVFAATGLTDIALEAGIWMNFGFFAYPYGGPFPMVFAGTVRQFPLVEPLAVGLVATPIVALRFFTDDRGQTWIERGLDKATTGKKKAAALRLFATVGAIQIIFFLFYNIPCFPLGMHSKNWPKAIQERSYLMDGICGAGTPRACRTGDTPIDVMSGTAISITPTGDLLIPTGATAPAIVPFIEGP